jgi:hypothetical protein
MTGPASRHYRNRGTVTAAPTTRAGIRLQARVSRLLLGLCLRAGCDATLAMSPSRLINSDERAYALSVDAADGFPLSWRLDQRPFDLRPTGES